MAVHRVSAVLPVRYPLLMRTITSKTLHVMNDFGIERALMLSAWAGLLSRWPWICRAYMNSRMIRPNTLNLTSTHFTHKRSSEMTRLARRPCTQ